MLLPRRATETVLRALEWSPITLIQGPRQAGKSVLVRDLVSKDRPAAYVTLDDLTRLSNAHDDPQGFVFSLPDPVTLDEVQRAPEIFLPIKLLVDQDRHPGRFLLTGSANVLLLPRLSESLTGRMRIITLWPFSQGEIEGVREGFIDRVFGDDPIPYYEGRTSREELAQRIVRGGFPQALELPEGDARTGWMQDYVTTLMERDVRDISAISDRVGLPRLLQFLAGRSSMLLNASELGRITGISRPTVERYLALFQKTYTLRLVPAWAGDVSRRLVKSPKILFADTGLAAHLSGLDTQRLVDQPDALGPMLETFVGDELLRQIAFHVKPISLLHYRDGKGAEVDWVLEDAQGRLVGVEVKATGSPSARDAKGLRAFADTVGERFHRGILLHAGTASASFGDKIWGLPVDALWRLAP